MSAQHSASRLQTERDVIETLAGRSLTMSEIYAACEAAGVEDRDRGREVVHGTSDTRSRRRARGALQTLRRAGRADRLEDGTWIVDGSVGRPKALLLVMGGDVSRMELVLASAERLLRETDESPALILADPPWGLGINGHSTSDGRPDAARANGERVYARDADQIVGGYVDVEAGEYAEFTHRWISAAARILRPGAYLAVVTGPGQAARVQVTAEDLGLTFLNQIIVPRPFALPTSRRFSHAHSVATVLCAGPEQNPRRFFATPAELPKAASGRDYPLDVWHHVGKHERRGLLRYPTMLHPQVPEHLIGALTLGPENGGVPWQSLVVDPFVGGGETAVASNRLMRRFRGGDVNPRALAFTAARVSTEAGPRRAALIPPKSLPSAGSRRPHDEAQLELGLDLVTGVGR